MFLNKYFGFRYFNTKYFPIGGDGNLVFTINQISRRNILAPNTLSIQNNLNNRSTCQFKLHKRNSGFVPKIGQEVIIELSPCAGKRQERVFGGTIDRFKALSNADHSFQGAPIQYLIECVDFNQMADKRQVFKIFTKQPVKDVIINVVEQFMADDRVTTNGVVDAGLILEKAVFSYRKVGDVFDDISRITGLHWFIDFFKDLKFFLKSNGTKSNLRLIEADNPPDADFCAYLLNKQTKDCPGIKYGDLSIMQNRETLMNESFVIAGNDTTPERCDELAGDGKRRVFNLRYALADIKRNADGTIADDAIKVGGTPVGNANITLRDNNKDVEWTFTKGEHEVSQNDQVNDIDTTPVPNGTLLEVTYFGLRPIVQRSRDDKEIGKRAEIEDNSGVYASVEDDEAIESRDFAKQRADGNLRRFAKVPTFVNARTDQEIIRAGELMDIVLPEFGIPEVNDASQEFLIDSVSINDQPIHDKILFRFTFNAVSTEHQGGWQSFFKTLEKFGRQLKLNDQDILIATQNFTENIDILHEFNQADPIGAHAIDCEECWPVGFAIVGKSPICKAEFHVLGLE